MFLMLVISRLSIVRMMSASIEDREGGVVEEGRAVHDHQVVRRAQRLDDALDAATA